MIKPDESVIAVFKRLEEARTRTEFLPDLIDSKLTVQVELNEGEAIITPSGWLRAIETIKTSVVLEGNLLITTQLDKQIDVHQIEKELKKGKEEVWPNFGLVNRLVLPTVLAKLQDELKQNRELSEASGGYEKTSFYIIAGKLEF